MSMVMERLAEARSLGLVCGKPLSQERTCVHVRGHDVRCSHSWGGTSGIIFDSGLLIDAETGEVLERTTFSHDDFDLPPVPHRLDWLLHLTAPRGSEVSLIANEPPSDPEAGVTWDFQGEHIKIGYDGNGHLVAKDANSNAKPRRIYSVNQRHAAVDLAREIGVSAAARKLDIPRTSVKNWVTRGIDSEDGRGGDRTKPNTLKPCQRCRKRVTTRLDGKPMCRNCWEKSSELQAIRQDNAQYFQMLKDAVTDDAA